MRRNIYENSKFHSWCAPNTSDTAKPFTTCWWSQFNSVFLISMWVLMCKLIFSERLCAFTWAPWISNDKQSIYLIKIVLTTQLRSLLPWSAISSLSRWRCGIDNLMASPRSKHIDSFNCAMMTIEWSSYIVHWFVAPSFLLQNLHITYKMHGYNWNTYSDLCQERCFAKSRCRTLAPHLKMHGTILYSQILI